MLEPPCKDAETMEVTGTSQGGKSMPDKVKKVTKGQAGDPRFLAIIQECGKRRCEILGLDAPKQQVHQGTGGGPIRLNLSDEELTERVRYQIARTDAIRNGTAPRHDLPSLMANYVRHDLPSVLDQEAWPRFAPVGPRRGPGQGWPTSPPARRGRALGATWAKLPPNRGLAGTSLGASRLAWARRKDAKGNYGFVYHLGRL
jgi:hypothetical protein